MDSRAIIRDANLLYKALQPLLALDAQFANVILSDLAQIVLICGRSSGDLSANELLAYLVVYALIQSDTDKLDAIVNRWDASSETRIQYQKIALQLLTQQTGSANPTASLKLPSILNRLDEEKSTHYLTTVVNELYKFAQVIIKADGAISMEEMEALSQIWQLLHTYKKVETYQQALATHGSPVASTPSQELEQALQELNDLIGLENIKTEVKTLTNFLKVQKIRAQRGMTQTPVSLHAVFGGPPGTGKTTVARLMGRIYHGLEFLDKGHLVETDRSGMVAGYVGQTAKKVDDLVNSALDGVLFIDEAYALTPAETGNDFSQEAIDILLERMEDYRDRLVVIVAGYTDEMQNFIESNPGLKSRFNRYFYFQDYRPSELVAIFRKLCEKSHFILTDATVAKLEAILTTLYEKRDRTFGNARLVRNLFEKTIERQANRLAVLSSLTDELLVTLLPEDVPNEP
jgi:AAA+ superfamily predicted ATPase